MTPGTDSDGTPPEERHSLVTRLTFLIIRMVGCDLRLREVAAGWKDRTGRIQDVQPTLTDDEPLPRREHLEFVLKAQDQASDHCDTARARR